MVSWCFTVEYLHLIATLVDTARLVVLIYMYIFSLVKLQKGLSTLKDVKEFVIANLNEGQRSCNLQNVCQSSSWFFSANECIVVVEMLYI